MLVRAEEKSGERKIRWIEADALELPFASNHFQLVTSAFGFRNLANYDAGLTEIFRVLAPGGEMGILDFGEPKGLIGKVLSSVFPARASGDRDHDLGRQRSVRVSAGVGVALPCRLRRCCSACVTWVSRCVVDAVYVWDRGIVSGEKSRG